MHKAGVLINTCFWALQDCRRAITYKVADTTPGPLAARGNLWVNTFTAASLQGTRHRSPKSGDAFLQPPPPLLPIRWRLHLYGNIPAMLAAKKRVARQIWAVRGFSHPAATWTAACNSPSVLSLQGSQPLFSIPVLPLSMPYLFLGQISL